MDDVHAPRGDGDVRAVVVLTAAGSGARLGHAAPKALVPVAGTPLLVHALRGLWASGVVEDVVVTVPAEHRAPFEAVVARAVEDASRSGPAVSARCVVGGPTRQASVAAGVAALAPARDPRVVVLVHDAARALTPPAVVRRVAEAVARGADVVVPVVPVTDSVVDVAAGVRPVDRTRLRAVQTPQGFARAVLERAHASGLPAATDDAGLVELCGGTVRTVPGSEEAFKVTRPIDLLLAEAVLRAR